MQTDEELVDMFRRTGDLEVLGHLYKGYMHMVYGLCMKYLKNREDSQDAVSQVFEVLVHDVPRFEIRNFKSWLYVIAKNHCLMKLRKERKQQVRELNSSDFFMESTALLHPIDEQESDGLLQWLSECMEQLNNGQRNCIELFYYKKKCYREIALDLNMDENRVKSHIQNGKRNLKICLEQKEMARNV